MRTKLVTTILNLGGAPLRGPRRTFTASGMHFAPRRAPLGARRLTPPAAGPTLTPAPLARTIAPPPPHDAPFLAIAPLRSCPLTEA